MSELLEDADNLKLMEELVSGNAVSVNISELSRILGKHRNTIKKSVEAVFEHNILEQPFYPFHGLYRVYPLLAVVKLDIPDCKTAPRRSSSGSRRIPRYSPRSGPGRESTTPSSSRTTRA